MLFQLRAWLRALAFILNDRGVVDEGEGDTDNADDTGGEADNADDTGKEEEEAGESEDDTGGEADNADEELNKMFGSDFHKLGKSYRELQSKHKPVEMENAAIKKWAEANGLKIIVDSRGNFKGFDVDKDKTTSKERARKFTEDHGKQFDTFFNVKDNPDAGKNFRELMKLFVQDLQDDAFGERDQRMQAAMEFRKQERDTEKFIAKVYPEANPDNPDFPEGGTPLYNRATEIYEGNASYQQHPKGQLFAVHEAAIELGISPMAISAAKEAGKKEGAEGKRILSKLGGGGAGSPGAGKFKKTGEVSLADFMSMSSTERQKYQEEQLKKKAGG